MLSAALIVGACFSFGAANVLNRPLKAVDAGNDTETPLHVRFNVTAVLADSDTMTIANLTGESDEAVTANVANKDFYYQISLGIGTPAQPVDFTLDTGSSDLWVLSATDPDFASNSTNSTDSSDDDGSDSAGVSLFNSSASSSFHDLAIPFAIHYGDQTYANGSLVTDDIDIGGLILHDATFALAKEGNSSTCVFGIGFSQDESNARIHVNETDAEQTYFNIPSLMKREKLIHSNAYSLWLNDARANLGSIMFGAVDSDKFEGNLSIVPFYNNFEDFVEHPIQTRIMMHGVTLSDGLQIDMALAVLIDSGTSLAYLPESLVEAIANEIGYNQDPSGQFFTGSTAGALSKVESMRMNFSGAFIDVPMHDLLLPLTYTAENGSELVFTVNGQPQSMLGLGSTSDEYQYILGDVFLRSMYAVFDLDHYEMAFAQTKPNVTTSSIHPIIAYIPNAVIAPGYSETSVSSYINAYNPNDTSMATSDSS